MSVVTAAKSSKWAGWSDNACKLQQLVEGDPGQTAVDAEDGDISQQGVVVLPDSPDASSLGAPAAANAPGIASSGEPHAAHTDPHPKGEHANGEHANGEHPNGEGHSTSAAAVTVAVDASHEPQKALSPKGSAARLPTAGNSDNNNIVMEHAEPLIIDSARPMSAQRRVL